jgi:hypothetical protein
MRKNERKVDVKWKERKDGERHTGRKSERNWQRDIKEKMEGSNVRTYERMDGHACSLCKLFV